MKQWVSDVLGAALDAEDKPPELDRAPVAAPKIMPVARKQLSDLEAETGDEPWSRPPFWAKA